MRKALDAGVDQFGGESCPELVVELVKTGRLSEARLDQSVRRLLRLKFQLGCLTIRLWMRPWLRRCWAILLLSLQERPRKNGQ